MYCVDDSMGPGSITAGLSYTVSMSHDQHNDSDGLDDEEDHYHRSVRGGGAVYQLTSPTATYGLVVDNDSYDDGRDERSTTNCSSTDNNCTITIEDTKNKASPITRTTTIVARGEDSMFSYCPQTPCMLDDTVRANILMGYVLIPDRYEEVLVGCGLKQDMLVTIDCHTCYAWMYVCMLSLAYHIIYPSYQSSIHLMIPSY